MGAQGTVGRPGDGSVVPPKRGTTEPSPGLRTVPWSPIRGDYMLFNSYQFMLFFPCVLAVYFVIPRRLRYLWLLAASYYFYMGWNARYAVLIAGSTLVTYICGLGIERFASRKKLIVSCSFIINIGILFFFKYFDFAWVNIGRILGRFGISMIDKPFDVLLPVCISFYIFQALGYTMDVYRGTIKAERNVLRYALFVSFFPQLVAGPIERSSNLLRQVDHVDELKLWNLERIKDGAILMIWGYFQKMVIADRVSVIVDTVYNDYAAYGSIERLLATALFAIQIYCDFASYSTIAIGAAKVMGFDLMENFNTPYFARSVQDFWRRWHISLSTWFRDYLYISLGGSRCSKLKRYRNIMITFLVSGLWHGAGWSFLIWGGLHGFYQIIGDMLKPLRKRAVNGLKIAEDTISFRLGQMIITFCLVDFAWIFFRMNSLKDSLRFITGFVTKWNPWTLFDGSLYALGLDRTEMKILTASLVILLLVDIVRAVKGMTLEKFLKSEMLWFRWLVLILLLAFIVVFGVYGPSFDAKSFIYFQF